MLEEIKGEEEEGYGKWMHSVTVSKGVLLEDLKDQVKLRLPLFFFHTSSL